VARDQAGALEPRHRPHRAELSRFWSLRVKRPLARGVSDRVAMRVQGSDPQVDLLHPTALPCGHIEAGLAAPPDCRFPPDG
jgi:hypothetical protein